MTRAERDDSAEPAPRDNIRVGLVVMILFFLGVVALIGWVCASQAAGRVYAGW